MVDREPTPVPNVSVEDLRFALVRLLAWPDLSQLPESKQVMVARICSLLARKPTAGHLIPRVLGEPEQLVLMTVHELVNSLHVSVASASLSTAEAAPANAWPATQPQALEVASEPPPALPKRSLVGKLWSKLVD